MFADPLALTINGTAKSLPKINQDGYGSEYFLKEADRNTRVRIRHTKGRPNSLGVSVDRHSVRIDEEIFATATAAAFKRTATIAIENISSDSAASVDDGALALFTFLSAANIAKLVGFES
nr:MAG: hypothetical protein 2 [Leviviridae sp.]